MVNILHKFCCMQAKSRITEKLNDWVMIDHSCSLTIDAKSPSLKLMAASAEPCNYLLTLAATNS